MSELIFGKNTIIEIIKSGHKVNEVLLTEQNMKNPELMDLIKRFGISCKPADFRTLDKLTGGNHQGIAAYIEEFRYYELNEVLEETVNKDEKPFFLILDGLEDVHNLGAIMRSADACGVTGIIIPKNRSVSLNATVAKLSSGAIEFVKVIMVVNINHAIKTLKNHNIWVVGTDGSAQTDYRQMMAKEAVAVVIGSEGTGMSRLVKENCDLLVKLPMKGHISSLNASVAASVIMYEVMNQRCPLK